jgi:murein L,D-transpeptidase YcbB/YkuD
MLNVVGTAVGGLIGWSAGEVPSADPASVRALFADLGVRVDATAADLEAVLRRFQARVGLRADGVAGPRTVHLLARYAKEARELRYLGLNAA